MSNPRLLLPLRVPELGPSLGKLVSGSERRAGWIPLDEIRYQLATRIIDGAGEARRLAANEERASALAAIGRVAWQEAWDEAIASTAGTLADRISAHLEAEAVAVGMSRKRRVQLGVGETDRRALAARLGSAGANLIPVLDVLERDAVGAAKATGLEPDALERWQETLKLAARRLEAAWLALERAVETEGDRWHAVADEVAGWRKPLWPVYAVGIVIGAVVLWLGLVFGGYVSPPGWLERAWHVVFGI
jgi:hypothetical protein